MGRSKSISHIIMSMLPSLIAIFMISSTTGMASDLGAVKKKGLP